MSDPSEKRSGPIRTVREMRPDEQPREKLRHYGAESLSDSELLAIILRTGSREMNVLETSAHLLNHFGGLRNLARRGWQELKVIQLRNLARRGWQELKVIPGIAGVKAITLVALFELSRRIQIASLGNELTIRSPEDAAAYFAPRLRDLNNEVFMVAFLNNAKKLTGYHKISSGGATATIVDIAEVMRQAVLNQPTPFCCFTTIHPARRGSRGRM